MSAVGVTEWMRKLFGGNAAGRMISHSAVLMMLVRFSGVSFAFISSMVLARVLGANGFGQYAHLMAVAGVLSIPAALGLPNYLVREIAGRSNWVVYLRRWADRRAITAGFLMTLLMSGMGFFAFGGERRWLFVFAALLPALSALSEVRRGLLQGMGLAVRSQLAPLLISPLMVLIGVLILHASLAEVQAWQVVVVTTLACAVSLLVAGALLHFAPVAVELKSPVTPPPVSTRGAIQFMWLGALYLLLSRTDLIMLGILSSNDNAGVYAVSSRAADLVPLALAAANMVIAPRVASCYREGRISELRWLLSSIMRVVFWVSLPIVVILFVGAGQFLSFFYGDEYAGGAVVMRLLVLSQFILVLGGPLGTILEMTGNERIGVAILLRVVVANLALNAFLIPFYGPIGAATATCLSVVLGRLLLLLAVRKLVPFNSVTQGANR